MRKSFAVEVWDTMRRHPWEGVVQVVFVGCALAACYAAIWIIGNAARLPR